MAQQEIFKRATTIAIKLLHLPRMLRLLFAMIFAVSFVLLIFPVVDYLYIEYFFNPSTVIVPSIVSVVLGALYYLWGWMLIVSPRQYYEPSWVIIMLYFLISLTILLVDIVLITMGISMLDALAG